VIGEHPKMILSSHSMLSAERRMIISKLESNHFALFLGCVGQKEEYHGEASKVHGFRP
jgi:hypothetical protein